jgi:dGTPase
MLREELEEKEKEILVPYAVKSAESKGRRYDEPKHPYRTEFQRDRDRIAHSTAFRRLEYKTQVFVNHEGDHYRTRLTHSLEVAYIARSISRALGLNEDLTEAIALAHDLGHTPFGHSGEEALNGLLMEHGGFEHNLQGLRVVDVLERRYPDFPGLNLTFELREGILKHSSRYDNPRLPGDMDLEKNPSLECQVVNMADEIAYNCHDIDDGLSSGILDERQLEEVSFWRRNIERIRELHPGADSKMRRHIMVRRMINEFVTDLVEQSSRDIAAANPSSADDVRRAGKSLLSFSAAIHEESRRLKEFLYRNMYRHPRLESMSERAREVVSRLFSAYTGDPGLLPAHIRNILRTEPAFQVVADYIAGMTDRFAAAEYERITGSDITA